MSLTLNNYEAQVECHNCGWYGEITPLEGYPVNGEYCPDCDCKGFLRLAKREA